MDPGPSGLIRRAFQSTFLLTRGLKKRDNFILCLRTKDQDVRCRNAANPAAHGCFLLGTSSVLDCIVRNATNTGARVQIANTVELPDPVGLTLDGGYWVRPCRVVWRTLTETGVEFLKTGVDSARS